MATSDMSDKATKDSGDKKKPRRPNKKNMIKSPVKDGTNEVDDSEDGSYCACSEYIEEEISIECSVCEKFWHACCVGLTGLCEDMVLKLTSWKCPDCFSSPHTYLETSPTVNVKVIQPLIKATVVAALKEALPKTVASKDDVKTVVKSYADITIGNQKKVIEEAAMTQSSKAVVEKVVRQLDADKVERAKRRLNVVIMNVEEPSKEASSGQKKKVDRDFCKNVLGMKDNDFDTCWRAGSVSSKPGHCRPLIVSMVDEATVLEWTKNGKGFKTETGYWINKDLCVADRNLNFLARQERRERMKRKA